MEKNNHKIRPTSSPKIAFRDSEFILVCTPTNYDKKNYFDTSLVERVIREAIEINNKATSIIKV